MEDILTDLSSPPVRDGSVESIDNLKADVQATHSLPGGRKICAVMMVTILLVALVPLLDLDPRFPDASKGLVVLLVTAMFWVTEVLPLAVSSLIPMGLYPLLGVVKASVLAKKFFSSTSFLFIAGFLLGLAIERWNLHTRFVRLVLRQIGDRIQFNLAAFMLTTWLLSMWISNTATMLCVMPMMKAFLSSLEGGNPTFYGNMLLAVGYSATVGGLATPVGTPTNVIFMGMYQEFWPDEEEFSFAKFCFVALPLSASLLVCIYGVTCMAYMWSGQRITVNREKFFQGQQMGKLSFEEMVVGFDMVCLVVLWFTASRIDKFPGWKKWVSTDLDSGSIGLMLTLPLFLVPCGRWLPPAIRRALGEDRCESLCTGSRPNYILDWDSVKKDFSWEILFVFGGGALIAHGTVECGLAQLIAEAVENLGLSTFAFNLVLVIVITFVTEVVSNMSTLNIFGPIMATAAQHMGHSPLEVLLGVTLASSFAFMLPMAGGPNMVVYSTGRISVAQMARFGFCLNILAILFGSVYITSVLPVLLGTGYEALQMPST
mmetsp:Transcript_53907/g.101032  ORF Transcript_53907/g.101032 Transcript_53907/m.101032 type:complete len:544 (-) Transcript_53907:104-1735(-)